MIFNDIPLSLLHKNQKRTDTVKLNSFEIDGGLSGMSSGSNPAKWEVTRGNHGQIFNGKTLFAKDCGCTVRLREPVP